MMPVHFVGSLVLVVPIALVLTLSFFLYRRRFLGTVWGPLLGLLAWGCGAAVTADRFGVFRERRYWINPKTVTTDYVLGAFCAGMLIVLAVPFVVRLYGKWLGNLATEQEKAPGAAGVRAWLSGGHLLLAVAVALCAWQGYGYYFWGMLALTISLLLAYPAFRSLSVAGQPAQAPPLPSADLSDERERVLKLLEDGKITAEEGAELLSALGQTARPEPPPPAQMTAGRKLLLLGAALVVVGFFLPWYSFDLAQELDRAGRMMSDFGNQMSRNMGAPPLPSGGMPMPSGMPQTPSGAMPSESFSGTIRLGGGDVNHGFGWVVLLLGCMAAVLPFVKLNVSPQAQKLLLVGPLAVGGFIIVYLLTRDIRHVSFGLPLVLAGYAVELIGVVRETRRGS